MKNSVTIDPIPRSDRNVRFNKLDDHSRKQFRLRNYQKALVKEVFQRWKDGNRRLMLQLPTGGGKTITFGEICQHFLHLEQKVLILAHREELILQAANKVGQMSGLMAGIIKHGYRPNSDSLLQVASVSSLANRLSLLEDVGLIVIDEAHHAIASQYQKILTAYPEAFQLGVTATPVRLDGSGFNELFDSMICGPTVSELIEWGYLSRFKLFADTYQMSTKDVRKSQGDYSLKELAEANNIIELSGSLVESYFKYADGKKCIVFAINVQHSQAIAQTYRMAGISAYHLDGNSSSQERQQVLQKFERSEIQVLTNCSLFTEGFDLPSLEAVQIARPTQSLSLWLQMVGRALRVDRQKQYAILIDHTKNWQIHGLPNRPRIWTLDKVIELNNSRFDRDELTGEIKEIFFSEELTDEPSKEIRKAPSIIEIESDLEEIKISQSDQWQESYQELLDLKESNGYKYGWLYQRLLEMRPPLEIWQKYAKLRNYKPQWAIYRFQEQLGLRDCL